MDSLAAVANPEPGVVVYRCRSCGDTFAAHSDPPVECPSCGGGDVAPAAEPFL